MSRAELAKAIKAAHQEADKAGYSDTSDLWELLTAAYYELTGRKL